VFWAVPRKTVDQWGVLLFWIASYTLLMWLVTRLEARDAAPNTGP